MQNLNFEIWRGRRKIFGFEGREWLRMKKIAGGKINDKPAPLIFSFILTLS